MSARYDQEAIELCRKLYCKYGGRNHEAIESEMRKVYPGWRRNNLHDRGTGKEQRLGWITKYGFDNSLRLHLEKLTESVNDDEQDLYIGIKDFRKVAREKAIGKDAKAADVYLYRDFCKLEIEARKNLDLTRDNLETFVAGYEKQMQWLAIIDPSGKAVKEHLKYREQLIDMAQAHYGKPEEISDGAGPGEDEGGAEPGSSLGLVG